LAVKPASPVLLIGSVPLADSEAVFRTLSERLAGLAARYPDGETGDRINWVRWQRHLFDGNRDLVLVEPAKKLAGYKDALARPFYAVREGSDPANVRFGSMGYAARARESYEVFRRLKNDGVIGAGIRFQVSLPTVASLLSVFVVLAERAKVEAALEAAMKREVDEMAAAIPSSELAIQWDIANEIIGHDGGMDLHYGDLLNDAVDRIVRHVGFIPPGVEAGIHLCYGDPGHKHVVDPKDAGTCAAFAYAIRSRSPRPVTWIHLPILRQWKDRSFYEPLSRLQDGGDCEIYLGLVHYTDGIEGTMERIRIARSVVPEFGVATECGFGRRDPATLAALLDIHRAAAEAVG
jgi:hypothetical protein